MDSENSILLYIRRGCFRIHLLLVLAGPAMQNFAFASVFS